MMSRIICEVEQNPLHRNLMEASQQATENTNTDAISAAREGDTVVITAGVPFGNAGSTNIFRIATVKTTC